MTILEQQGAAAKQAARKLAIAGTAKKKMKRWRRLPAHSKLARRSGSRRTPRI